MRKLLLLLCACCIFAVQAFTQTKTVTGIVKDDNGNPLPGVNVSATGGKTNVITSVNGSFSINISASVKSLTFSYIGYENKTVSLEGLTELSITLATSSNNLNEVIVTGYATVKKTEYAGATSKVAKEKINFVPNASFDQILQGRAPGLLITAGSGQPGASARVQIRGASSITGGNDPLYIIDGQPVEAANFRSLNPADFESVEVLRDAVATAQYGNRGSNGVIVVTTKRGRAGKPVLSYDFQVGRTEPGKRRFDMMNTAQLLEFQEKLGAFGAGLPGWDYSPNNPANADLTPDEAARNAFLLDSIGSINTNWEDVFFRNGKFQNHNLSLSGGTGSTRFYLSGGLYDEEGIGLRSDLKRYSFRANIDHKSDKLTVSLNSGVGYTKSNFIESEGGIFLANPFAAAYLGLPYQNLYNPDGSVAVGSGKVGPNAYDRVVNGTSLLNNQIKATLSTNVNYDITKNIYIGAFAGLDYRQTVNERSVYPGTYAANTSLFPVGPDAGNLTGGGSYATGYNNFLEYVLRGFAGYRRIFNEAHEMDIRVILEYTRDYAKGFNYTGYGISPQLLNTPAGITAGTVDNKLIPAVGGFKEERVLNAGTVVASYNFKSKYALNASFRRDGSSQLPEANRFQNFMAGGVTWNILKENFALGWKNINDLRLRASIGTAANADGFPQGYFGYLASYGNGSFAGSPTTVATLPGNDDLKWERIRTINFGLNVAAFQNRLTATVDVYEKKSFDVIVTQKLPLTSGFREQDINAATVSNKGIELALNVNVLQAENFVWSIGGNVAYNKNRVVDLGQSEEFEQGTEIVKEGLPLGSHFITEWAGVDASTGRPLYYTKDGKITSVYSDDDRVAEFGTFNAPWIGGFNTTITYKGFTLDALFSFQSGFKRFNNQDFFQLNHAFATQGYNLRTEMLDIWTTPGQVTNIQAANTQRQFTSKDIQDASYLRFRNVSLSYNLGDRLISHLKVINGARIFVQAQNLYTWTNWTGFDPEDDNNIASYEYPTPRTLTLGLNVSFK